MRTAWAHTLAEALAARFGCTGSTVFAWFDGNAEPHSAVQSFIIDGLEPRSAVVSDEADGLAAEAQRLGMYNIAETGRTSASTPNISNVRPEEKGLTVEEIQQKRGPADDQPDWHALYLGATDELAACRFRCDRLNRALSDPWAQGQRRERAPAEDYGGSPARRAKAEAAWAEHERKNPTDKGPSSGPSRKESGPNARKVWWDPDGNPHEVASASTLEKLQEPGTPSPNTGLPWTDSRATPGLTGEGGTTPAAGPNVRPARLDSDGTAKGLTEIVAVMPPDGSGIGELGTVHTGQATHYVVRPTADTPSKPPHRAGCICVYCETPGKDPWTGEATPSSGDTGLGRKYDEMILAWLNTTMCLVDDDEVSDAAGTLHAWLYNRLKATPFTSDARPVKP